MNWKIDLFFKVIHRYKIYLVLAGYLKMLVVELNIKKNKLPAVSSWLNPNYTGSGDLRVSQELGKSEEQDPQNWKKDFAVYTWQYPKLQEIKEKLNKTKHMMDEFRKNPTDDQRFSQFTDAVRPHDALRGKQGILASEYNAEIVTNAYLKMYESMLFVDPMLEKKSKARDDEGRVFRTLHIAEAPGNFLLAINQYLKTNYATLSWDWFASSWRNINMSAKDPAASAASNTHYLEDQYGIIAGHKDKWIFGADGDGDITSTGNLRSFQQTIEKTFAGKLDLMTSDVKYVPMEVNFDEEEYINKPVHMGHLLCALMCLEKGGSMLLKEFTFFEAPSVCLLYLAACCFDQLMIIKPETSRPANSEVYILGIGYKKNLTPFDMERLLNILNYIRPLNNEHGSPAIFQKKDVPQDFVDQVIEMSQKMAQSQIDQLEKNIALYKKNKNTPIQVIKKDFYASREKASRDWIEKYKFKELKPEDKMMKHTENNRHSYKRR